jgi:hypothetical protein
MVGENQFIASYFDMEKKFKNGYFAIYNQFLAK